MAQQLLPEQGDSINAAALASQLPAETRLHGRRILACLNQSMDSEVCVRYALSLARTFGGDITLLHVVHTQQDNGVPRTHDALSWELARQEALRYLDGLGERASEALGRPVDVRLEQGHPAERIVDVAREIGADVTVLGSHGDSGMASWTLGPTVQQLLVIAQTSVLVAHPASASRLAVTPKHILVPLDGSRRSESVLPAVAHIAGVNGAKITLVHVVQEPLETALLGAAADMALAQELAARKEAAARRYLGSLQTRLAQEGTTVNVVVIRHANERQGLLEVSQREEMDLIVLSAHGAACDSARSFGGVTTYLLTHSPLPVFVLQDLAKAALHRGQDAVAQLSPPARRAGAIVENV